MNTLLNFFSRLLAALGSIVLSIIVAKLAGPEALGQFAVFLSILGVLVILSRRGLNVLLVREVASVRYLSKEGVAIALLRKGAASVVGISVALGFVGAALLSSNYFFSALPGFVVIMPVAVTLVTLLSLVGGYAKGQSRAWVASLLEMGGISGVTAMILYVCAKFVSFFDIGGIAGSFLGALVVLCIVSSLMILRDMPRGSKLPRLDLAQTAGLRTGQVDVTVIALTSFLTTAGSFLLAAPFLTETDLGLLRAAERFAILVGFSVLVINPVIAPRIVQLSRAGELKELRRCLIYSAVATTGAALCVLLPLLIWPDQGLALMGVDFAAAVPHLRVMACAQFFVAATSPLALLLIMSGRERLSMLINLATLALAFGLFTSLSAIFGATGFAVAYAMVMLCRSLLIVSSIIYVHITTGNILTSQKL